MAYNKSLELRKIKVKESYLGDYTLIEGKYFRAFSAGATIYSRDGETKYLVSRDGSFRKL